MSKDLKYNAQVRASDVTVDLDFEIIAENGYSYLTSKDYCRGLIMKYRRLTKEQFEELPQEFINF